ARRRPISPHEAPRLTAAVLEVLGDPAYRRGAERIALDMAGAPGADEVLADLLGAGSQPGPTAGADPLGDDLRPGPAPTRRPPGP
ncbi:MAG TPA: hypothetical protein VMB72_02160, partial [Acidimicrobiales bacterium]|nr:hypothetical protein [Acidimicrobiales bacterium]